MKEVISQMTLKSLVACHIPKPYLKAILEASGAKLSDVVKVTVFLSEGAEFDPFNDIYKEYFSEPYPARTIAPAANMGFMVQIDAIAHIS